MLELGALMQGLRLNTVVVMPTRPGLSDWVERVVSSYRAQRSVVEGVGFSVKSFRPPLANVWGVPFASFFSSESWQIYPPHYILGPGRVECEPLFGDPRHQPRTKKGVLDRKKSNGVGCCCDRNLG